LIVGSWPLTETLQKKFGRDDLISGHSHLYLYLNLEAISTAGLDLADPEPDPPQLSSDPLRQHPHGARAIRVPAFHRRGREDGHRIDCGDPRLPLGVRHLCADFFLRAVVCRPGSSGGGCPRPTSPRHLRLILASSPLPGRWAAC